MSHSNHQHNSFLLRTIHVLCSIMDKIHIVCSLPELNVEFLFL